MTLQCSRCGCEVIGGYCTATDDYHRRYPLPGRERDDGSPRLPADIWDHHPPVVLSQRMAP